MLEGALEQPDAGAAEKPRTKIYAIPVEFYGGKNPAPAEVPTSGPPPSSGGGQAARAASPSPQQQRPPVTVPPTASNTKITQPAAHSKMPIIIGAVALVVIVGGIGVYMLLQPEATQPLPEPTPIDITTPEPEPIPEEVIEPPVPEVIPEPPAPKPSLIPDHAYIDTADSDNDGLTDIEEELWSTDPAKADTDDDKYSDQLELFNLYNPIGLAPQRLADTKLSNIYINPELGYSMYYPASWVARALDESTKREILFTAITGEYVQISVYPYPTEAFPDWFAANFPNERLASYKPFTNRFKVAGIASPDNAVMLVTDNNNVYVLRYDGGTRPDINYRSTFRTMVQSFKPVSAPTPIDLQAVPADPLKTKIDNIPAAAVITTTSPEITATTTFVITNEVTVVTTTTTPSTTTTAPSTVTP